jgi:hypothetical protein
VPILMTEAGSETSGTGNLVLSLKLAQRLDRLSLRVYEATTDGRFGSQISSIDVRPNPTYFEPNRAKTDHVAEARSSGDIFPRNLR